MDYPVGGVYGPEEGAGRRWWVGAFEFGNEYRFLTNWIPKDSESGCCAIGSERTIHGGRMYLQEAKGLFVICTEPTAVIEQTNAAVTVAPGKSHSEQKADMPFEKEDLLGGSMGFPRLSKNHPIEIPAA